MPDNFAVCSRSTGVFESTWIYTLSVFTCSIVRTFIICRTTHIQARLSWWGRWKNNMLSCISHQYFPNIVLDTFICICLRGRHAVKGSPWNPCTQEHTALWLELVQMAFVPHFVALHASIQFPSWQISEKGQSSFTVHCGLTWTRTKKKENVKTQEYTCIKLRYQIVVSWYLGYRFHCLQTQNLQDKCMQLIWMAGNQSPHIFGHCYMGCWLSMDSDRFRICMQVWMSSRGPLCTLAAAR